MKYTMSKAGLILTICITVLGIFDLYYVLFSGTGSSVSAFLVAHGFSAPAMVFTFGFLAGHLFGAMQPEKPTT